MKNNPNSLSRIRESRGLTMQALGDLINTDASTINKLEKGITKLNAQRLQALSAALGVTADEILAQPGTTLEPPRELRSTVSTGTRRAAAPGSPYVATGLIPLYGFAAGSLAGEHQVMTDVIDEVPAPPALQHVRDAYVMMTKNDSMVPRYLPNEYLYVHPHQAVRAGDHVIIQVQTHDGSGIDTWVKRFDTETADEIYVSQYNPPGRLIFKKKYVKSMHRVLPPNELF
ncbi:helix-turn-helix transcriptional regulator [Rhizobium herbae]|uniref:Helix-turn-helix transcriptional regulator n=1 Tax=Rhizobium herbae TaxID=508661 RepID=A0ABS7H6L1_9HYPH|nr:XRE family transcriptional regulator [Rhizobium herbae]MBW9062400.1 helix-turn-helix transcriptional regulator [Rhizobium herbae]